MVLEQVDLLEEAGSDIIILLDHAQDWTTDPLAAEELRGIDVIVQAGGEFHGGFQSLEPAIHSLFV